MALILRIPKKEGIKGENWHEDNKQKIVLVEESLTEEANKENFVKAEKILSEEDNKDVLKTILKVNNINIEKPITPTHHEPHPVDTDDRCISHLIGATCQNYFANDSENENSVLAADSVLEENQMSNNENGLFLEDSLLSVGEEQVYVIPESPPVNQIKQKHNVKLRRNMLDFESEDEDEDSPFKDELSRITKKLQKLPLSTAIPKPNPPSTHPSQREAYDPSKVKHEDFYGDVKKTVVKLAQIIETMPVLDEIEREAQEECPQQQQHGLRVPLYDHQVYGLKWLAWREGEFPGGGVLADEMGLGKTIMMIGLMMKTKMEYEKDSDDLCSYLNDNLCPSRTTLVVCPLACLIQWELEIGSKGKDLQVFTFHGTSRKGKTPRGLARYDVILTTYETIANEIPKSGARVSCSSNSKSKRKSPLALISWHRIILDEAHKIRNSKTKVNQSICSLTARHRWAVTGTPVHNYPEDFFSIVKFLQLKPFDEPKVWNYWIGKKTVKKGEEAYRRLHTIGKALLLRRTKSEVESMGGNVRRIPSKSVEVIEIEMTEAEQAVYGHLMLFARDMFKNFMQNQKDRGKKWERRAPPTDIKFSHLFAVICRLRQCAVLPHLIETMLEEEDVDENDSFDEFKEDHLVSKRNPIFNRLYESSKIKRILEDLEELREKATREEKQMNKVVIVSSWTKLLHILNEHLKSRHFTSVYITGDLNIAERQEAIERFNTRPKKPQIVLLSLGAGGVGINLIGGNHVFFVEPHWNPQLELQAQDRVHRFGQEKEVFIRRYISQETIETHVLELQDMKLDLADGVLNNTKKTSGGGLSVQQMKLLFGL